MKHIFYFIAIAPLVWESTVIMKPKTIHNLLIGTKNKKYDDFTSSQKAVSICMMFYLLWVFIGLFSFQWLAFLLMFVMSFVPKKLIIIRWVDSVISFSILMFVILNAYHFHIDLFEYAKHLLNLL